MVICVPWGDIFILGENCIEKRKREKQERKSESQPTCFIMHWILSQKGEIGIKKFINYYFFVHALRRVAE